jgi:hypothetical protein
MRAHGASIAQRASGCSRAHALGAGVFALSLLTSTSCSLVIDSEKLQCKQQSDCAKLFGEDTGLVCVANFCVEPTCEMDADCKQLGGQYEDMVCIESKCVDPPSTSDEPPEWLCLDEPSLVPSAPGPFKVKLVVQDVVSMKPLLGVQAHLCRKLDSNCDAPDSMTTSDDSGTIELSVAKMFNGYVLLTRDDLVPTYYFFEAAIDHDLTPPAISLLQPLIAQIQAQMTGAALRSDRGLALVTSYNCMGVGAEGVALSSGDADKDSVLWYSSGGLPSKTPVVTDSSGTGGYVNAPPGNLTIEAQRASDGRSVGVGSLTVKAGGLSIIRLSARGKQ